MQSQPVSVLISGGQGWLPSPFPAAKVVSVVMEQINPDANNGAQAATPRWTGVAEQTGEHSPQGALTFEGTTDGTFGAVVWAVS